MIVWWTGSVNITGSPPASCWSTNCGGANPSGAAWAAGAPARTTDAAATSAATRTRVRMSLRIPDYRPFRYPFEALKWAFGEKGAHTRLGGTAHALAQQRQRAVEPDVERVGSQRDAVVERLEAPRALQALEVAGLAPPREAVRLVVREVEDERDAGDQHVDLGLDERGPV